MAAKVEKYISELAKCSRALHGPLGVALIEFFTQFHQYTALSIIMAAKVEEYIAFTSKMQQSFT